MKVAVSPFNGFNFNLERLGPCSLISKCLMVNLEQQDKDGSIWKSTCLIENDSHGIEFAVSVVDDAFENCASS